MHVSQVLWNKDRGWHRVEEFPGVKDPKLILYFGALPALQNPAALEQLQAQYPQAMLMGCSSGGEIVNPHLFDDVIIANLIHFEKTPFKTTFLTLDTGEESFQKGQEIGHALKAPDLKNIFILSDGVKVNGVSFIQGIASVVGDVPITGGFAGDRKDLFTVSLVGLGAQHPISGGIAALGLYGEAIRIGHGSVGGWDRFGPERVVTKSRGSVVYEIDHKPVLKLYKSYLGDQAQGLPATGLFFPLAIQNAQDPADWAVRTIIGIDEAEQSVTFAADIPEGAVCQIMHGSFDRLVEGATQAAQTASDAQDNVSKIGILVSCIGRRLLMGQRVMDEIEAIHTLWQGKMPMAGFYSYGEISPLSHSGVSAFHNQTMTVTTWGEVL